MTDSKVAAAEGSHKERFAELERKVEELEKGPPVFGPRRLTPEEHMAQHDGLGKAFSKALEELEGKLTVLPNNVEMEECDEPLRFSDKAVEEFQGGPDKIHLSTVRKRNGE